MIERPTRSRAARGVRPSLLFILLALPFLFPAIASAEVPTKRVLVITSYDVSRPAVSIVIQAMRSTIRDGSQGRVEFFYEFQGNTRIPTDKYEAEMVGYLRQKYEGENLNLIVALGAPSLKFLLKHESELFTDTPKLFYFHDEREEAVHALWPHVTGVWARFDISQTLDMALALQPETRRVVVVSGNSAQDRFLREQAQSDLHKYEGKLEFTYLNDLTIEELKNRLAALPEKSVVLYLSFFLDSAGNAYSGQEVLSMVAPTSSAPIYGISETYMGAGIVGGSLINFEALGKRTGEVALRLLSGEMPQAIIPQTVSNMTVFDWRELHRRGLSERELPPGSIIRFKEPTFWEHYKWYIVGVVAAFILEALLIAWLLVVQRRRKRAERDSERYEGLAEDGHRRLDEIVSNVPGIVWELLIDADTNRLKTTFVSDYVETMLGYTPEEWLSTPSGFALSLMTEEDRERVTQDCKAVISTGKGAVTQFRWKTKDGRLLWVESHLSPIVDADGKTVGLRGVSIDITDQRLAEDAQRQSEERNRAILRALPDLMFLQTRDGVYLDYHAKDVKDLFVPPDKFIGKNIRDVLPPELAEKFLNCFKLADETGEPQVVEYELTLEEKEQWYEARIVRTGENILSVVRDITERKRAEEALRESEENYRTLFESMDEGFTILDMIYNDEGRPVDLVFRVANPAFERLTGWHNAVGRRVREFAPDLEEVWFENYAQVAATGESMRFTNQAAALNGWYEVYAFPLGAAGSRTVAVLFSDVSERIRAEEAIRRSEAVLAQAGQMASLGAWEVDLAHSDDINENPLVWSDEVFRIYGYEPGSVEVSSELFFRHVHPDDRQRIHEEIQAALDGRRLYQLEHRIIRADGAERVVQEHAVFDVDEAGGPRRIIGAVQDITERRASDEALRQSEERFRNMADTAPVLIWMAGTNNLCTYVNKQWLDFTGRSVDEELGSGWTSGIHPDDYARCLETYNAGFTCRETFKIEYRLRRADGEYRWVLDTGTPRLSSSGEFLGYIGSCVDIHDRKESEEALQSVMEEELRLENNFSAIVGHSDAIRYVLRKIEQVAPTDSTVLIMGETGTGKELVARAIHSESRRGNRPLVKVNCAALSASLIESELFGHEKGAFTGATSRTIGRFELADGATIFLDEIGDLPLELQVKLLRVIQEGELERLGGSKTIKVDVRIIAATNRNLWDEVQKGLFREDLWYRLNVFPITMPPLRQRMEDIGLLIEHFIRIFSRKMGKKITSFAPATLTTLRKYSWPGNVRELGNVIERAVINNGGPVLRIPSISETLHAEMQSPSNRTLEEMEREYILTVLGETGWKIEGPHGAAAILGLHPSTLRTRLAKLKIQKPQQSSV